MKTHFLNKLIRRSAPLMAAALQLSLTTATWAQLPRNRGTLYTDNCYYILKANLVIPAGQPGYLVLERQGCRVLGRDGRVYYHDYRTKIWQDELSGTEYVLTNGGWTVLAEYQAQQQQTQRGPLDGVSNPVTLQLYKQTLDNLDKARKGMMGMCGGNRSDIDQCNKEMQAKRQAKADADKAYWTKQDSDKAADKAYWRKQDSDKAMEKTAEAQREREKDWSKRH
jgi:hypothetical protein